MRDEKTSQNTDTKNADTKNAKVVAYEPIGSMESKDIRKELRDIAPRHGAMSLTERNCLEALAEGGAIVADDRDAKKRQYARFIRYPDGSCISIRPDGFRYLVSQAKRYGLLTTKSDGDKVVTYTLPKNSDRLAFVKRLVELFDNC